jgi:hypothetical protein
VKAHELFGVIVRAIGLVLILSGIQAAIINPIFGAGYGVVGLLFILRANWIVRLCYPQQSEPLQ